MVIYVSANFEDTMCLLPVKITANQSKEMTNNTLKSFIRGNGTFIARNKIRSPNYFFYSRFILKGLAWRSSGFLIYHANAHLWWDVK